jgi:hypothetical protein
MSERLVSKAKTADCGQSATTETRNAQEFQGNVPVTQNRGVGVEKRRPETAQTQRKRPSDCGQTPSKPSETETKYDNPVANNTIPNAKQRNTTAK